MAEEEENSGIGDMLGNLVGQAANSGEFPGTRQDTYTEVSEQGWFSRIFGSIFTAIFGFIIFLGSFVVLYKNEGSVNEATLCKDAVAISATSPSSGSVGKFVAATGPLNTDAQLGDEYLAKGNYVTLSRSAEMYAWVETKHEKKEKKTGGGERTITTYDYDTQWTSSPESSSSFKVKAGHHNPSIAVDDASWKADAASVGVLKLAIGEVSLPGGDAIKLSDDNTRGGEVSGNKLYVRGADPGRPRVGDVRLSYSGLATGGEYTVFGKLKSPTEIAAATLEGGRKFYRVFEGTKEAALKQMNLEYSMWIWGFRLLGFLMCWGGMRMMMEPLNTVLDVLPFLGSMGRGVSGFLTFPIALVLSGTTIVVAWITHNLFAMLAIGALTLFACVALFGRKKATATTQTA